MLFLLFLKLGPEVIVVYFVWQISYKKIQEQVTCFQRNLTEDRRT